MKRMPLKNALLDTGNFVLYFLLLFMIGTAIFFYVEGRSNPISETIARNKEINTLLVVYDEQKTVVTSLYIYNGQTKRASIFDIPGNTGYIFPDLKRVDRIDTVFSLKKPDAYTNAIKQLLDLEESPFYIFLSLDSLARMVDLIGGVEIFIAHPVFYSYEDRVISLPSGSVVLDGDTTIQFLLMEESIDSDRKVTERRQRFMQSFLKQLSRQHHFISNRYVKNYLDSLIVTNIEGSALSAFWAELSLVDSDSLIIHGITGSTRNVTEQALIFPHYEGKLVKEMIRQTLNSLKDTEIATIDLWPRKIEIQNGTSRNGLASSTQRIYESMGFTVSKIGNAPADVSYTVVLDLSGNIEATKKVAEVIRGTRIYSVAQTEESDTDSVADVQVILGKDFDGRYVQQITLDSES